MAAAGVLVAIQAAHQRTVVQRNAIAPAFQAMFPPDTRVVKEKSGLQTMAYTSTPFRGLNVLLRLFPLIHTAVPHVRLKVFSSMQVYRVASAEDETEFGTLYQACRDTAGVEYVGSLSQPALAEQLKQVAVLAYPNTFPETSCIAVMEAMAAGCIVVTSELGPFPKRLPGSGDSCRCPTMGPTMGRHSYRQWRRLALVCQSQLRRTGGFHPQPAGVRQPDLYLGQSGARVGRVAAGAFRLTNQ